MIDQQGFAAAFVLVTLIGIIPVVLTLGEWYRQSRLPKAVIAEQIPLAAAE